MSAFSHSFENFNGKKYLLNQVLPKNSNKCNGSKLNVVNEQTVIAQSWYFAQNKQKWFFDVTNLNGISSHS